MPRSSVATDNFNRASLGANWTQTNAANAGDLVIDSSIQITGSFDQQPTGHHAAARWVGAGSFNTDQYSETTLLNPLANDGGNKCHGVQISCTGSDATRSCYEFYIAHDSATTPTTFIVRWNSGTRTVLFSGAQAWAANDKISLEYQSGVLYGCRNGTRLGGSWTITESTLTGGTPGAVSDSVSIADDWEGGNMTSGTGNVLMGQVCT